MEQAPGPRGSPQVPQGPAEGMDADPPLADTAKTDSCGASFLLWQRGQAGFSLPRTRASKRCLHRLQMYSKIGIRTLLSDTLLRLCHPWLARIMQAGGDSVNRRSQRFVQLVRVIARLFPAQQLHLNQAHGIDVGVT